MNFAQMVMTGPVFGRVKRQATELFAPRKTQAEMVEVRKQICEALEAGPMSTKEVAQRLGITVASAQSALVRMKKKGLMTCEVFGRGVKSYAVWSLV